MTCLYITEQGSRVSVEQGKFIIETKDGEKKYTPKETVESIIIFGAVSMSAHCQKECLEKNIRVSFLSTRGKYFGKLESTNTSISGFRLKKQVYLSDDINNTLLFSKKIINAKINNQLVVLKRYIKKQDDIFSKIIKEIVSCRGKIEKQDSIEKIMGYEGMAAKYYFEGLSMIVDERFAFKGRSKRPPKDAFNALISLGYSIVFHEIYAEVNNKSISPYIGFMHKLKENHPALISDLLEEWRAVLVDSTVMSLINGHEILIDEFNIDEETGAVIISNNGVRILVKKMENKMNSDMNYLEYLDTPVSFRKAIWWQVRSIAQCIDCGSLELYNPLLIR